MLTVTLCSQRTPLLLGQKSKNYSGYQWYGVRLDSRRHRHPSPPSPGGVITVTLQVLYWLPCHAPGHKVRAWTGWPCISTLWLGELASLIYNFYLSVAAHTTDPSLRYTLHVARTLRNQLTTTAVLVKTVTDINWIKLWVWRGWRTDIQSETMRDTRRKQTNATVFQGEKVN